MPARFYFEDPSAPAPNRPRSLGVTVLVLSPDGRSVLMDHRADSDLLAFLGGATEEDETVTASAHREIREETGLGVAELTFVGLATDPSRIAAYPDGNVVSLASALFVARLEPGEPRVSAEAKAFEWVPWERIDRDRLPATQHPLLDLALAWREDGVVRAR